MACWLNAVLERSGLGQSPARHADLALAGPSVLRLASGWRSFSRSCDLVQSQVNWNFFLFPWYKVFSFKPFNAFKASSRSARTRLEEEAAGPAPPAPAAAPHGVAGEPGPLDDAAGAAAQEIDQDVVELNAAADALDSLSESSEDSAARSVSMPGGG